MKVRSIFSTLVALVAMTGAAVLDAPSAGAHSGSPPSDCQIVEIAVFYGGTCFEVSGDDQWVYDGEANGWRVGVEVQTEYGKRRVCENSHGAGTWHECRYDHREGECVRFKLYERNGDGGPKRDVRGWTTWYSARTGGLCTPD